MDQSKYLSSDSCSPSINMIHAHKYLHYAIDTVITKECLDFKLIYLNINLDIHFYLSISYLKYYIGNIIGTYITI